MQQIKFLIRHCLLGAGALVAILAPVAAASFAQATTSSDGYRILAANAETPESSLPQIISRDISSGQIGRVMASIKRDLLQGSPHHDFSIDIYFEAFVLQSTFPEINQYRANDLYEGAVGWPQSLFENAKQSFFGWTYNPRATPGRAVIQMSPHTFDNELTVNPRSGLRDLRTGSGYQALAHELVHAILYEMHPELDDKYHHCMFHVENGYLDRILKVMVSEGLMFDGTRASSLFQHGRAYMKDYCEQVAAVKPDLIPPLDSHKRRL